LERLGEQGYGFDMSLVPSARALIAGLLLFCLGSAAAIGAVAPRDGPDASVSTRATDAAAIAAQVERLRRELASGESATFVLDRWCSEHGLAPAGSVRAQKLSPDSFPIPAQAKAKLGPKGDAIAERRVRLHCGGTLLSEARLWFVPKRLTADMRRQLARTTRPFGSVVAPLHFRRAQSRIAILSSPGDRLRPGASTDLLSVEAYLVLPDGRPFAFTQEVYKTSLLDWTR
jgi:chorismate-pyruvate lyase